MAAAVVCLAMVAADVVQRFVVRPWVKLRPRTRTAVLGRWINLMAWMVCAPVRRLGGGHFPAPLRAIPDGPGTLVLMNHQSLFDIPLVIQAVDGGYPRIVTRGRYSRGKPLVSLMVRLYEYPVVESSANPTVVRETLSVLADSARSSTRTIVLFPEGTRSRDGRIRRFKTAGLTALLAARPWTVYVLVVDGFWQSATFADLLKRMDRIRGRLELAGTLEWSDPCADPRPFIGQVRQMMIERLAAMRAELT